MLQSDGSSALFDPEFFLVRFPLSSPFPKLCLAEL